MVTFNNIKGPRDIPGGRPSMPQRPAVTSRLAKLLRVEYSFQAWDTYLALGASRKKFAESLSPTGFTDPLYDMGEWSATLQKISKYADRMSVTNEAATLIMIIEARLQIELSDPIMVAEIADKEYGQDVIGLRRFFRAVQTVPSNTLRSFSNAVIMHTIFEGAGLTSGFEVTDGRESPVRFTNWVDLNGQVKSIDWERDVHDFTRMVHMINNNLDDMWEAHSKDPFDRETRKFVANDRGAFIYNADRIPNNTKMAPANRFFAADAYLLGRDAEENRDYAMAANQYFICLDINPADPYDLLPRLRQMKAL